MKYIFRLIFVFIITCLFSCEKEPENIVEYQYLIANHAPYEVKVWLRSKTSASLPRKDTSLIIPSGGMKTIQKITNHTQYTVNNFEADNHVISIADSIAIFNPYKKQGRFNLCKTKRWNYLKLNDQQAQYILTIYKLDFR